LCRSFRSVGGGIRKKEALRAIVFPSIVRCGVPIASLISGVNVVLMMFRFRAQACRDQSPFISLTSLTLFLCSILVAFLIALSFSRLAICSVMWFSSIGCLLKCLRARRSALIACVRVGRIGLLDNRPIG